MLDQLKSFLANLTSASSDAMSGTDDIRVAAAALMIYVADSDGLRGEEERAQLRAALTEAYDLKGKEIDKLLKAGEKANREAIDFYQFTSVLSRQLSNEEKVGLVRLLWATVYADGELHEIEDNVVWRIAELIGVEQRERVLLRQEAREAAGIGSERD